MLLMQEVRLGNVFRLVDGRQQHRRENCYDRDDDEEFDQGERGCGKQPVLPERTADKLAIVSEHALNLRPPRRTVNYIYSGNGGGLIIKVTLRATKTDPWLARDCARYPLECKARRTLKEIVLSDKRILLRRAIAAPAPLISTPVFR